MTDGLARSVGRRQSRGVVDQDTPEGLLRSAFSRRAVVAATTVLALVVVLSVGGDEVIRVLGLPKPNATSAKALNSFGNPTGPSRVHWLGVDPLGRDVLSRLLVGGRVSLLATAGATVLSVVIGVPVGVIAGYFGGVADALLGRVTDLTLGFPVLLLALGLGAACSTAHGCAAGTLHPGVLLITLIMGLTGWPYLARLVRSQTVALRSREFVLAARMAGVSDLGVVYRDVLPHLTGPVTVFAAFALPGNMLFEAGLAFLGVGVPPPTASWGNMLADSADTFTSAPWYFLAPTVALAITAVAFNVVADAARRAMERH